MPTIFLFSCSKKEEEESNGSSTASVNKGSCDLSSTLTASTKVPLLMVRVQYKNASFHSDETTWAKKMFGTNEGQMNHYMAETTYSKYQFSPVSESSGCSNDGVITVNMGEDHPDTRAETWASYAFSSTMLAAHFVLDLRCQNFMNLIQFPLFLLFL